MVCPQRPDGRRVEVAVDRRAEALAHEQELEHRDVPAERARAQRPRPEERPAERAERPARPDVGEAGDRQPLASLERAGSAHGRRPDDAVDLAQVQALSTQGHLEPGVLGIRRARGRGRRQACRERRREDEPRRAHGPRITSPRG